MKLTQTEHLRPAGAHDVDALLALRLEAEKWLPLTGTDQWSDSETGELAIEKWRQSIDDGRTWVVVEGGATLATISRGSADRDFWREKDEPESGFYLYKLIVSRAAAGRSLGVRLIDWASSVAECEARQWVRIDVWRTNHRLHEYYESLGFRHVRTESPAHRKSGWMAQRPASARSLPGDPILTRAQALSPGKQR
ncbi:GNAT family N-acetyltransferase [Streptomyces sp. NPDC057682]|uniref:GNAT family N-acetyltransferase n=1 Tax=Streptomyces sp. NPDC057682 TaxID=3346210 RepID=UPI0036C2A966